MKAGGAEVSFITKHPAIEDPVGSVEATPGAHKEVQTLVTTLGVTPQCLNPLPLRAIGSSLHLSVCATCS